MSDPINITAIYDINTGRDRIEITDAIAAEILRRGLEHSRHGLPITPQTITMPPTKPPAFRDVLLSLASNATIQTAPSGARLQSLVGCEPENGEKL